jgi:CubicO group peptidase (beta-lactamase class C family)
LTTRLDAAIDSALTRKTIVGMVVLVSQNGRLEYSRAAGLADREAGRAMTEDAIFRLASCTKPIIATTVLAMADAGLLDLDDSVTKFLPYLAPKTADGQTPTIKIRHLLTHTAGLVYGGPELEAAGVSPGLSGPVIPLEENMRRLSTIPLMFKPGTQWSYSMSIDVLATVVAAINGSDVEGAVRRYVTGPLGMKDTGYFVSDPARLAQPYGDGVPEPERMTDGYTWPDGPVFELSRIFNAAAPQSGGAGMAGTAGDLLKMLETIRDGNGRILRPGTAAEGLKNQIGDAPRREQDAGKRFGFFGAVLEDPMAAGNSPAPKGTVDWGGVYGHNWFIDPQNGISVVSYSNTAPNGCNGPFREEIRNAVYGKA